VKQVVCGLFGVFLGVLLATMVGAIIGGVSGMRPIGYYGGQGPITVAQGASAGATSFAFLLGIPAGLIGGALGLYLGRER
jgi:hypothetical protein